VQDARRFRGRGVLEEAAAVIAFDVFHHDVGLQSIVT
jgi:hypothetical protein